MELFRDIASSHEVFIFGSFNCASYSLKDLEKDVGRAQRDILKINDITYRMTHYNGDWSQFNDVLFPGRPSLHPRWLIADDLFAVFQYHFAVSQWVSTLNAHKIGSKLNVFSCVIPQKVVSLYDDDIEYEYYIEDIREYLKAQSVDVIGHGECKRDKEVVIDIVDRINEYTQSITLDDTELIVFLFDRKQSTEIIFRCKSMEQIVELTKDYFIGMHFNLCSKEDDDGSKSSKCWLHYGNGQRLRFWAEQLVWFIPRLFVKGKQSGYQFAKRLYSDDFKHGFCLNLNDPIFNKYYHILTGYEHRTVNYRRTKHSKASKLRFGFRDYAEHRLTNSIMVKLNVFWTLNEYSTDDILEDVSGSDIYGDSNVVTVFEGDDDAVNDLVNLKVEYEEGPYAECTSHNPSELWRCRHAQNVADSLNQYKLENFQVDAGNVTDFDNSAIIRGLDHLLVVHDLFTKENKKRIQSYFKRRIRCGLGTECTALRQHCSRRREVNDGTQQNESVLDEVESMVEVTDDALCSAHCYLLHSDDTLYRISGQSSKFEMNPFSTPVIEQQDEEKKGDDAPGPLSIDFGVHVLQWLAFGEKPRFESFEQEMVGHPASTLTPQLLDQYRLKCAAMVDGEQWTEENIDELLCLKLYSDCTEFQNLFRRAYWKRASKETKRSFYQWATKMYQTFLFHAQPIPKSGTAPKTLYHGLNKVFQVCHHARTGNEVTSFFRTLSH